VQRTKTFLIMTKLALVSKAPRRGAFIYCLLMRPYIYFGETQQHPVIRLSEHLRPNGSFCCAVTARDSDALRNDSDIWIRSFFCELNCLPAEQKLVTQFIEHEVHLQFIAMSVSSRFQIVSDTERTAPRSCRYLWAKEIAKEIAKAVAEDLERP
jgi:hypothetical protein